ncbi:MAG: hypothetical protein OEV41_05810 [Gammaproteobacteria bacterium]|nr:hypothetical protein [Gammaproteobacteria bacterium]
MNRAIMRRDFADGIAIVNSDATAAMRRRSASRVRLYAAVLGFLGVLISSPPSADETTMTAIGLLTSYSGERARQFEPYVRYSKASRIVGIEIHAVGMDGTTARYSGRDTEAWKEVNNILRIKTADGYEGISGVDSYYQGDYSDEHLLALQGVAADLVALESLDPVVVAAMLERVQPQLSDEVRSSIDIALWDLAARKAGVPLYELLGAKRDSMEPYASLPFYDSLAEHIAAVREYAKLGYTNFKYHVWGSIEEDMQLVKLTQQAFADTSFRFMVDLEEAYALDDALRLGAQMDQGLFVWLEGPIADELFSQYGELRQSLALQIIPAGYRVYSREFLTRGIEAGAWDAGRFDATVIGGISKALELLTVANEAETAIEIQSWGHSLAQAANLHLMLANERTRYFEAPMPKEAFEFGMKNGNLMDQGRVVAPEGPGLGITVDWDRLATADFHVSAELDFSAAPERSN